MLALLTTAIGADGGLGCRGAAAPCERAAPTRPACHPARATTVSAATMASPAPAFFHIRPGRRPACGPPKTGGLACAGGDVLLYAKGLAARAGMDVRLSEAEAYPVRLQGPKSKDVVRDLFGDDILGLPYYYFRRLDLDAIPVILTRTGWTSEVGYELYLLDASRGTDLWERIMEVGRPYQIRPTGPSDIRRIEGGIFNWGADMTYRNNPFEMGLDRLVDLDTEADFVARDALSRIRESGVKQKIVGVEIDGDRLEMNATKWPVSANGASGTVTSAIYSPRLEKNIGFAWLPIEHAGLGRHLSVETPDGVRAAMVVPVPFIDPGKQIPKA